MMIYQLMKRLEAMGVSEIPGEKNDNPLIVAMHYYGGAKWAEHDEIPWCSSCINFVAQLAGLECTKKANARSWLDIGNKINLKNAQRGDIVIFWRGSPDADTGHVAVYESADNENVTVIGGNQNNCINTKQYPISRVIGVRRLRVVPIN